MELYEAYDTEEDGICQYKSSKKFYFAGIKEYCRVQDGGCVHRLQAENIPEILVKIL